MPVFYFYKYFILLLLIHAVTLNVQTEINTMVDPTIVIHGGAGNISRNDLSASLEKEYRILLEKALKEGYFILIHAGKTTEAVEASLKVLEDSPLFNAGKGSALNHEGNIEMDAAIMNGENLNAGAVAGVAHIKNPISAAIKVMENSGHVMLIKDGAEAFAKEQGLDPVESSYFRTKRSFDKLKDEKFKSGKAGTVGAVALDHKGNLSAGTSTGGLTNKKWGRVGDSPIIGAGTYANNNTCAVSCTGVGEYFIRSVAAYDVSALMEYKKYTVKEASEFVIHNRVGKLNGSGGLIALDGKGNIAMPFNTTMMFRGYMNSKGIVILIFEK
jgi:beta-aspartyl-peptidase (threonine type)